MEKVERRYWLWVTRPDYYMAEDGTDREDLDPDSGVDSDGWWTCHKDTQKGDLVFLWRTSPKSDIGYLIQTESGAYSIADDEYAAKQRWDYACDYQVLYKFRNPVTLQDLHRFPYVHEWKAYRGRFQRRAFEIPADHWFRLNQMASAKNPGYAQFLRKTERQPVAKRILLEEQLEEALVRDLGVLRPFGFDVKLYVDPGDGTVGRQLVCTGNGGRIDLLCCDKKKRYVVIELKNVRAGQNTFGQICNYMGWVQERIAKKSPVVGLVISRGYDVKFESSMKVTNRVFHLNVEQLGFD